MQNKKQQRPYERKREKRRDEKNYEHKWKKVSTAFGLSFERKSVRFFCMILFEAAKQMDRTKKKAMCVFVVCSF